MKQRILVPAILFSMVVGGCSDMPQLGGGPKYGDNSSSVSSQNARYGRISALEVVQVDDSYKLGVGTAESPALGDHIMGVVVIAWLTRFPLERWGESSATKSSIQPRRELSFSILRRSSILIASR